MAPAKNKNKYTFRYLSAKKLHALNNFWSLFGQATKKALYLRAFNVFQLY